MPGKTSRKLMRHGTSAVVAIPPDYRNFHNLDFGDEVSVIHDDVVIIAPSRADEKMKKKLKKVVEALR